MGNGSDKTKVIQASILSSDVISSIVESPATSNVAVTQEEIAQFEQAANYNEAQAAQETQAVQPKENTKTQVITAAPTSVTVNISYDDMKKVVEEHEQETVVHEEDSLS